MKQNIHWYPGHMKKATIKIEEKLKIVDCVIELLDARIPLASRNRELYELTKNKKRLVVLTKADLADEEITKKWLVFFKDMGFAAIFADLNNQKDVDNIIKNAEMLGYEKREKNIAKGLKEQPLRAMVIGIPNVGKSTLINKIAKRHAAGTRNTPGFTRSQQWIKVSDKFELLDNPGILPSLYSEQNAANNLALVGSINDDILPHEDLSYYLLDYLKEFYPVLLTNRYGCELNCSNDEILCYIAKRRGLLTNNGGFDTLKSARLLLNEFKNGKLGRVSLERETKCL